MKKLIIFDLDGTLLNTKPDMANSMNYLFKVLNVPLISLSDMKETFTKGRRYLIEKQMGRSITDEENNKYQNIYNEYYFLNKNINTKAYDGVVELLSKLKEDGYILTICSNKLHKPTVGLTKEIFSGIFDYVIGSSEEFLRKPNKDMIVHILKKFNVKEEYAIYIGDTYGDIKAAKNAGIYNVYVTYGYGEDKASLKEKPDGFADSPSELYDIINNYFKGLKRS